MRIGAKLHLPGKLLPGAFTAYCPAGSCQNHANKLSALKKGGPRRGPPSPSTPAFYVRLHLVGFQLSIVGSFLFGHQRVDARVFGYGGQVNFWDITRGGFFEHGFQFFFGRRRYFGY